VSEEPDPEWVAQVIEHSDAIFAVANEMIVNLPADLAGNVAASVAQLLLSGVL
jgi:hypothetical protein